MPGELANLVIEIDTKYWYDMTGSKPGYEVGPL